MENGGPRQARNRIDDKKESPTIGMGPIIGARKGAQEKRCDGRGDGRAQGHPGSQETRGARPFARRVNRPDRLGGAREYARLGRPHEAPDAREGTKVGRQRGNARQHGPAGGKDQRGQSAADPVGQPTGRQLERGVSGVPCRLNQTHVARHVGGAQR